MRHIYKKILFGIAVVAIAFGLSPIIVAAAPFLTAVGGTGTSTPSGIMYGDNGATSHLNTLVIGSNLTLSGGTLSATGGGSSFAYPFPGNATSTQLNFLGGASTTLLSVFRTAYFGGTATTTINSTGDLFVAGSTTLQNATAVNATSSGIGILNSKGCNTTSALTTDTNGTIVCGAISGSGGAAFPFTPVPSGNATGTVIIDTLGFIGNSSSTLFNLSSQNSTTTNGTSTSFAITNAVSALLLTNSIGSVGKYGGSANPCTNQAPTTISAVGALGGCSSINNSWWSGTQLSVANGGTGVTSVGTNMVLSSNAAGNVVPTSTPSIAAFYATSTTATSSIGATIWFTPDPTLGRPLYIGTSTRAMPIYGYVQGGIDYEYNFNGNTGFNVVNDNSGTCASEGYWADGNIPALNSNYAFFGFLNVGWTGSGCAMGNGLEQPLDTILTNPTGGLDIEMASTTQVKMQVYGKNGVKVFSVTNDTGVASTTNLILSGLGGTGTRCMQVGTDGTVSANASACGTGGGSAGAQSSSTVAFVIYPVDQSTNPSQYFLYNASSTAVVQSASFQTLLARAYSSIGAGGAYSGTSKGTGPGGAIFLTQGTFYTNATTTCNGNEQFSTLNAPRCEVFGAGQEATKVVVVAGSDFLNFDHGAIPSVHDMSIYTTGYEKAIVATSSNPNIRSIWQFDFHNLDIESTTTFATTTAFYLGNILRGQIYNIETYGQNNSFWLYAEGNFNVGGLTITRSFLDFGSAATSTAFKFTQQSTGFVNEVEGYYNEAIGRTTGATYIDSTGLAFSHFNDSSAEQMDVLVDGKAGTISNQFDFAYSINRNGGANIRGCRFWGGSYDNQCSFQNGNNDTSAAIIDDMNANTDFPNRIAGSVTQSAGTGSASSTAVANYQIINFHGSGTFDANFKPDTDWAGYQIWSKVIAKSYKSFLTGANAASGLLVDINTSIATNVGVFIQNNTNFAHAGDMLRIVLKNASDSANAIDIQNLGTGNSIIATSTRGTDFVVTGLNGFTGVGTTTPWGLFSILPNGVPSNRPEFVVGSTSRTDFLIGSGGKTGVGSSTPFGFFSVNPNNIGTAPLFVIGSSSVTNFMVKSANVASLIVGSTTAPTSPATITGFFVNQPTGTGTFASSTLVVGDPSTTTSRSQINMNSNSGAPVCIDVRGTTLTVTAGVCP